MMPRKNGSQVAFFKKQKFVVVPPPNVSIYSYKLCELLTCVGDDGYVCTYSIKDNAAQKEKHYWNESGDALQHICK
jgi:hypothetical protein